MDNYEVQSIIGEGMYGLVYKCLDKTTQKIVAIKKFIDGSDPTVLREIKMIKRLFHDNIVQLLDVFTKKGKIYVVFEFVDISVYKLLQSTGRFHLLKAKKLIFQALQALSYLHRQDIIHRDIKPENFLIKLENDTLKLCDFGFAREIHHENHELTTYVSTRYYRSPEQLVGMEYGKCSDVCNPSFYDLINSFLKIWSIGCVFIEMLTGNVLFKGNSDIDQLQLIIECLGKLTDAQMLRFKLNKKFMKCKLELCPKPNSLRKRFYYLPPQAIHIIESCLIVCPERRATANKLISHKYFDDIQEWYERQFPKSVNKRKQRKERLARMKNIKIPNAPPIINPRRFQSRSFTHITDLIIKKPKIEVDNLPILNVSPSKRRNKRKKKGSSPLPSLKNSKSPKFKKRNKTTRVLSMSEADSFLDNINMQHDYFFSSCTPIEEEEEEEKFNHNNNNNSNDHIILVEDNKFSPDIELKVNTGTPIRTRRQHTQQHAHYDHNMILNNNNSPLRTPILKKHLNRSGSGSGRKKRRRRSYNEESFEDFFTVSDDFNQFSQQEKMFYKSKFKNTNKKWNFLS